MSDNLTARLRNVQFWQAGCDVRMQAAARIEELEDVLAKAMAVVEMIASADVDAVLGQAVDLSCEIIGNLKEKQND